MSRLAVLLAVLACGPEQAPPPPAEPVSPPESPPESLAIRLSPGVEIWFMEGRTGRDSGGTACYERSLEIRDSAGRRRVPLLYTLEAPTRLDDSSVQARVFLHCRAGDTYRVSLQSGRPTPLDP